MAKSSVLPFVAKADLTPWYEPGVRPVRAGVFQRRHTLREYQTAYSFWNGNFWGVLAATVKQAENYRLARSAHQELPWRGMLK